MVDPPPPLDCRWILFYWLWLLFVVTILARVAVICRKCCLPSLKNDNADILGRFSSIVVCWHCGEMKAAPAALFEEEGAPAARYLGVCVVRGSF